MELTDEQLAALSAANPISLGFPREPTQGGLRPYVFGKMNGQLDDHRQGRRS